MTDERYMERCLQLARKGCYYVAPNPMVGAVLVSPDGKIMGEGWHRRFGGPHAEVEAFLDYDKRYAERPCSDLCLYVSLEPCSHHGKTPPCADMIVRRGVKRVVVGCLDPNPLVSGQGIKKLRDAGIEVTTGCLNDECRELNKRFLCLHEKHRPYVILKWAQTSNGMIAPLGDDERQGLQPQQRQQRLVLSTAETKQLVHRMRAENMAIMVGTNTVVKDNPRLLTTHWSGRHPLRVTIDNSHRIPDDAEIFSPEAETIVYTTCHNSLNDAEHADTKRHEVVVESTDFKYILQDLAQRNIHSLLVEGGGQLLQHIIDSGLYDEIHIETADMLLDEGVKAPSRSLLIGSARR